MVNVQLLPKVKSKGNLSLLDEPLTALFCSNRCPGDLILKTYDLTRAMRDAGIPVIGGFQTSMELECLRLLLRGGRVEAVEKDVSKGLSAVRGDVKALGDEQAQMGRRLSQLESGRDAGEPGATQDANTAPRGGTMLRREFPDLVTRDPAEDDEAVFGEAWPLIDEWRGLKETHPNKGKGVEWLRTKERLLSLELTLLEGHGMTLPPETYPLRGFERGAQTRWRHSALSGTRRALAKRELLRKVGRFCTFGLGWR